MENVKSDIEDNTTATKPKETLERKIYLNEIDIDKGEVRLIKLNPGYITGMREKYIRCSPDRGTMHDMTFTILEYNGRERLVVEPFLKIVQILAFEHHHSLQYSEAYHILPLQLSAFQKQLNIIRDAEPESVERVD